MPTPTFDAENFAKRCALCVGDYGKIGPVQGKIPLHQVPPGGFMNQYRISGIFLVHAANQIERKCRTYLTATMAPRAICPFPSQVTFCPQFDIGGIFIPCFSVATTD